MPACRRSLLTLLVLVLASAMGGCGNKGDLVKPTVPPASAPTAPAAPPVAAPAPTPGASASDGATR